MKISVNGKTFVIATNQCQQSDSPRIKEVLEQFAATPPYAVALNGEFVPQENYQSTAVSGSDQIDIVSPVFGG